MMDLPYEPEQLPQAQAIHFWYQSFQQDVILAVSQVVFLLKGTVPWPIDRCLKASLHHESKIVSLWVKSRASTRVEQVLHKPGGLRLKCYLVFRSLSCVLQFYQTYRRNFTSEWQLQPLSIALVCMRLSSIFELTKRVVEDNLQGLLVQHIFVPV